MPENFDELSQNAKLSALYHQLLELHTKINDVLARLAKLENAAQPNQA